MLPSVLIAAALAGQGIAVPPNPSAVQPAIVVTKPRVPEIEPPGDFLVDSHPVLRFRSLPEGLKHLPFPSNPPPDESAPKRGFSPASFPPFTPFGPPPRVEGRNTTVAPPPSSDSIQERIKALEWGIAALRANGASADTIEMLQKDLDAAKRDAKKSK